MVTDCFLPSHLSYNDLSTCVVEEFAEVAIMMEAGEVKGEATQYDKNLYKKNMDSHSYINVHN